MSAPEPAIASDGLGRDYGSTRALDALDLVVRTGTIVGLLGPNGAGKTTTMLLLATLLGPSRGTARVFGHDIARERVAIRRRLGLVFQEASIDGLLTVRENLTFAARLAGLGGGAARQAVANILESTGLANRASQPARELSTGWRRLTDLARATLHRPDLLILDEPTVGLDPEHRDRAWRLLETECRERGTTVLFSTHYLTEAERCDDVLLLADGRVVGTGTPAALMATVGEEVLEIEGPDAPRLLSALDEVVTVRLAIKTARGYRIGISGPRDQLTKLAAAAPSLVRFTVRPPTLDDVYFARTQDQTLVRPAGVPRQTLA
jgi:ABC-2 type transport system ATP-binding protein